MAIDSSRKLGPGFRFHPTDEELVRFYLKRKVTGKLLRFDYIAVVDVYKFEPWDLPCKSKIKTRDLEWYFFSVLDRKYGNGSRTNRATEHGYWKTTGKDREVRHGDRTVGMKKTLVYHRGRAPRGARTNWVMHEYKLVDEQLAQAGVVQDAFVLCRVFEKSGAGPKNGEKYGAPLNEEEWDVDDHDEEHEEKVPKESDDLDEKLVPSGTVGGAGFSPSNFFPGESSRQPEHSQAIIKQDLKPQEVHEISKPQNGQPSDMSEQYGVVGYSVIGDNDVPFDQDPFMGLEDLDMGLNDHELYMCLNDLDQSLDFNENLPSFDDGYLETNDLGFQNCGNHTEGDPSGNDMINEYLACSDDDIYKYLSFDSPMHTESENSVPNQGSSLTQQNAEGETTDMSVASKPEAQSGKAISSEQQNPQESKLVSGNTNPFVKQANKWLASIPAAPAFAAEFPTKEIALGLHPGAQSSNSAHITTGMISITDITLRGNAMDWTMGKNGGFNTIISAGFSQPNFDSAAMMPVSGLVSSKTAFVLSHGWIFVMGFSVLVLSMSFKIGSIMYSGK